MGHIFLSPMLLQADDVFLGGAWAGPGQAVNASAWGGFSGSAGGPLALLAETGIHNTAARGLQTARETSRYTHLSLDWSPGPVAVRAGHRYLPVETEFLADTDQRSLLPGIPSARNVGSLFVGPSEKSGRSARTHLLPGVFTLERYGTPGVYWQSPWGAIFAHPASGMAALVARGRIGLDASLRADWIVDANRSGYTDSRLATQDAPTRDARLWEGYARLQITDRGHNRLRLLALRDNDWDLVSGQLPAERRGRSGAAAAVGRPLRYFSYEGAGMDRSAESFRMGGVLVGEEETLGFGPLLRGRFYRVSLTPPDRGVDVAETEPRDGSVGKTEDRAVAPGIRWRGRRERINLFAEARERGRPCVELAARVRRRGLTLSAALLLRRPSPKSEVLYAETGTFRDGGPLFYHNRERVLRVEARGGNVGLLLATAMGSGRPDHYARIQMLWNLRGGGRPVRNLPQKPRGASDPVALDQ